MKKWFSIGTDKDTGIPHSQWVDLVTSEASCSCKYGSFYSQTKKNKGKFCRHIAECRRKIAEAQCNKK